MYVKIRGKLYKCQALLHRGFRVTEYRCGACKRGRLTHDQDSASHPRCRVCSAEQMPIPRCGPCAAVDFS